MSYTKCIIVVYYFIDYEINVMINTLLSYNLQNEDMQQQIIKETFQLVSKRDDNVCNFLEGGR